MSPSRTALALTAGLAGLAAALAVVAPVAASASTVPDASDRHMPATRFVIHETIDHAADLWRFTATSPLCPSGTFADAVTVAAEDSDGTLALWSVDTTFTCDSGDTFTAHKFLVRRVTDHGATNHGAVSFTGGTGAFAHLVGHGRDIGASVDGQASGTISGHLRVLD